MFFETIEEGIRYTSIQKNNEKIFLPKRLFSCRFIAGKHPVSELCQCKSRESTHAEQQK